MNKRNKRPLLKATKFQKQFSFCSHLHEINEKVVITGKSLSEALIFASINPHYDNRLIMELP